MLALITPFHSVHIIICNAKFNKIVSFVLFFVVTPRQSWWFMPFPGNNGTKRIDSAPTKKMNFFQIGIMAIIEFTWCEETRAKTMCRIFFQIAQSQMDKWMEIIARKSIYPTLQPGTGSQWTENNQITITNSQKKRVSNNHKCCSQIRFGIFNRIFSKLNSHSCWIHLRVLDVSWSTVIISSKQSERRKETKRIN